MITEKLLLEENSRLKTEIAALRNHLEKSYQHVNYLRPLSVDPAIVRVSSLRVPFYVAATCAVDSPNDHEYHFLAETDDMRFGRGRYGLRYMVSKDTLSQAIDARGLLLCGLEACFKRVMDDWK